MGGRMTSDQFKGWVPFRFFWQGTEPYSDWCYVGDRSVSGPSFSEIIDPLLRLPFNQVFRHQTPTGQLKEWQTVSPGLYPAAFIFHVSYCGSKLVSETLASLPSNLVLSEVGVIDSTLRTESDLNNIAEELRIEWLRSTISALAQPTLGEDHLFITLNSWNLISADLIRQVYPDVPWIILYRDPLDVLASHLNSRDVNMIPDLMDPGLFGISRDAAAAMTLDEYCVRVLQSIYAQIQNYIDDSRCMFVGYGELADAVWSRMTKFAGLSLTAAEVQGMQRLYEQNSTDEAVNFHIPGQIRGLAKELLMPLFERIESANKDAVNLAITVF